ncbi:MAG TPA: ribbon-helix-helix domain-containing protein [Gemmataceae bacterium]|nr:ribbon-helix-helix domain-containing protein [Gemmataceae bacterium]
MTKSKGLTLSEALEQVADRPAAMKPVVPAREPLPKAPAQPSREGTKTVAGHFAPLVSKQLRQMALDRDTNLQQLLREALNDLFRKHGKPPVA